MIRYRFSEFTLSPRRRLLMREGTEVPLIPRYMDLLILLVERRHEAVHRRDIFERVWTNVIVSDTALSQAVRTIRRTLGDDSQEPKFIRTVARHGYRFVFEEVYEEEDDDAPAHRVAESHAPEHVTPIEAVGEPAVNAQTGGGLWTGAATGAALMGFAAGGVGGLILAASPGSNAPIAIAPVLAMIGGACGAIGGAGVGAGISLGETRLGSRGTIIGAALGGGLVGLAVQWLARWSLTALLGLDLGIGGGLEGLVIGAAAGVGYSLSTERRLQSALVTAGICGLAAVVLTLAGRPLVGGTIHAIADAVEGSRATLAPLGRLVGEPDFGPVSRLIAGFFEGALFGLGITVGTKRLRT